VVPVHLSVDAPRAKILVCFYQTIQGVRLDETVWDNFFGPHQDVDESSQIGFTQHRNFHSVVPIVPNGIDPGTGTNSQIMIPFGNLLSETLLSSIDSSRTSVLVAFDSKTATELNSSHHPTRILEVKVDSFFVWEEPLNHLNYSTVVSCRVRDSSGAVLAEQRIHQSALGNELGGVLSSSRTFLDAMNASAGAFTRDVITEILRRCSIGFAR
jgi:hypothetical protein